MSSKRYKPWHEALPSRLPPESFEFSLLIGFVAPVPVAPADVEDDEGEGEGEGGNVKNGTIGSCVGGGIAFWLRLPGWVFYYYQINRLVFISSKECWRW